MNKYELLATVTSTMPDKEILKVVTALMGCEVEATAHISKRLSGTSFSLLDLVKLLPSVIGSTAVVEQGDMMRQMSASLEDYTIQTAFRTVIEQICTDKSTTEQPDYIHMAVSRLICVAFFIGLGFELADHYEVKQEEVEDSTGQMQTVTYLEDLSRTADKSDSTATELPLQAE
jgi:hypothetical protein